MHARTPLAPLLLTSAALLACGGTSSATPNAVAGPSNVHRESAELLVVRDDHDHGGMDMKAWPLHELNETLVFEWHGPTPPSYATHDFEDDDVEHKYPYLMGLHALFMSLAFFGALPIGMSRVPVSCLSPNG